MSTIVYMKMLEKGPSTYDRRMRFITLGRIDRIKKEIASHWIKPEHRVLEIGCGTGSLAKMMTGRGASVTAIDVSEEMLAMARKNAPDVRFIHMSAVEIDRFYEGEFDFVVATLSLSELTGDELDMVLKKSMGILKKGGRVIIADEVVPEKGWQRVLSVLVRLPLTVITYILTQETTHPLKDIMERLNRMKLKVIHTERYMLGTLRLIVAEKV